MFGPRSAFNLIVTPPDWPDQCRDDVRWRYLAARPPGLELIFTLTLTRILALSFRLRELMYQFVPHAERPSSRTVSDVCSEAVLIMGAPKLAASSSVS